ncbi:MAG TPA: hypothetical protein VF148_08185 [Acidimicrobiia bacterium]
MTVQVAAPEQAAGASGEKAKASWLEVGIGFIVFVGFLILTVEGLSTSEVTFTPADGITALALFYVIAFAIERFLEFGGSPIELVLSLGREVDDLDGSKAKAALKVRRDTKVATAISDPNPANAASAAKSQADVDKATKGRSAALAGIAGGLGVLAAHYLNADFLGALGVTGFEGRVGDYARLGITGLVVAGGSKQLHDLISNVSKSAEDKSTPEETSTAG